MKVSSSSPQPVWFAACFPQLDSTVLATSPVELAIGGKADGPDRAMVTLLNLCRRKLARLHRQKTHHQK